MWQAIRDNTRRSRWMIFLMALLLLGLGGLLGRVLGGPGGGLAGVIGAGVIWAVLMGITVWGGDELVLFSAGAREIGKEDMPRLWNVVEEMTIAAGLASTPRVYILDSYMQNAFATGRSGATARLVVTQGLVRRLSRDELQGVVAHEIGHIRNEDIRFMTTAVVMLGSVTLLADACRRTLWFGGGRRSRLGGAPQVYVLLMALLAVAAVLAPLFARLLYLACSRQREFLADATAARLTRYPEGLASALEKIAERVGVTNEESLRALAPMYVVNPLAGAESSALFRTHPSTEERVRILRSMGGAGWVDYERAWRQVRGRGHCLEPALVDSEGSVALRPPSASGTDDARERGREAMEVFERDLGFLPIRCECGLGIRVPDHFPRDTIRCPRCNAVHAVPQPNAGGELSPDGEGLLYRRRSPGWDAFRCGCGHVNQLSPGLRVESVRCKGCGRRIRIGA
jgi:heat shock protein HtpX